LLLFFRKEGLSSLTPTVTHCLAQAAHWLNAGQPAEALPPLREAAGLQPGDANIQHDLGLACLECGHLAEAIAAFRCAVAINPRFADAFLRLGIALEMADALDDALAAYRRAVRLQPSLADAHYRTGALLDSLGQTLPAVQAYRRAAAAAPKTMLGRIAAARGKRAENCDHEAEKILRHALTLDPLNAVALDLLGNILAETGRFAEARDILIRATELSPQMAGSYYDIVRCRPIAVGDAALLARMRAVLEMPALDVVQRSRVHLALGKAEEDLGRYEAAMQHFDAAEALRNSTTPFDPGAFSARVDWLIASFTPAFFSGNAAPVSRAPSPILILGLPRSGTTLVEQMLSAHPKVHAGGELPFWNDAGVNWERSRLENAALPAYAARSAADHALLLRSLAPRASHVTDKMPLNFQWAGLIHTALPNATIIHCRRAPIDTAVSIHQTHFNPRMPFPTGGTALVSYMRDYQRLCAHWRHTLPANRFIELDYADLTATPEPVIRRCVAACGLEWHEACLRPERNPRIVKTPSKWQARQPIYATAHDRWRRYEPWLGALRALVEADTPIGRS
jgi:tetratricopeptide (TPR) repeat protein